MGPILPDGSTDAPPDPPKLGVPDAGSYTVSSTAVDSEGSTYFAGTFVDAVRLGDFRLTSKGAADAFVAKSTREGAIAWARDVGSSETESDVRVTLDDTVKLLGRTRGGVDCGGGPLPKWSSEAFFVCVYRPSDGAFLAGGTFPMR